jgi:hypothetical protein
MQTMEAFLAAMARPARPPPQYARSWTERATRKSSARKPRCYTSQHFVNQCQVAANPDRPGSRAANTSSPDANRGMPRRSPFLLRPPRFNRTGAHPRFGRQKRVPRRQGCDLHSYDTLTLENSVASWVGPKERPASHR